jgi:hypothetical protein
VAVGIRVIVKQQPTSSRRPTTATRDARMPHLIALLGSEQGPADLALFPLDRTLDALGYTAQACPARCQ